MRKYFEIPEANFFSCSFTIGKISYRATFRKLSTSEKYIWTVRDTEGVEIFTDLYLSNGVNYADLFADFEPDTTLKVIEANGRKYLETDGA